MKNLKNKRGITLISLVITVIVILIIAIVAISLLTGEENIYSAANDASSKYNTKALEEQGIVTGLSEKVALANSGNLGSTATSKVKVLYPYHTAKASYSGEVSVTEDANATEITNGYNTIYTNNRWYFDNPYPGHEILCTVEVYVEGYGWGTLGGYVYEYSNSKTSNGMTVGRLRSDSEDYIVLQTAITTIVHDDPSLNGDIFGKLASSVLSAPVRVIVTCLN